ncbi:MAG: ribonuclease III [Pseudomonadota bacterium]|nr:ribonuclease III [Pseudomonadota bacterium]
MNNEELEKIIDYKFNDIKLLKESLTHSSFKNQNNTNQERLEFLGDRVLGLVISDYLFKNFNNEREGFLTNKYRFLIENKKCADIAKNIGLINFLKLGNSEKKRKEELSDSVLANTVEAIIGAVFIDGGYVSAQNLILNLWKDFLTDKKLVKANVSPKNILQEYLHSKKNLEPKYVLISKDGEDHNPLFTVELKVESFERVLGLGSSIKEAELNAAENFLNEFNIED